MKFMPVTASMVRNAGVKALTCVEFLIRFFRPKSGMLRGFVLGQFIVKHSVCSRHTTLQIATTHAYTVRCQIRCLSRAKDVIVVVTGPSVGSVVFPIGALLIVLHQLLLVASVRRTFLVGRCRLRCSLQFRLECLAFCRVGSEDTLWLVRTLGRKQVVSSRHSAPPRHARTSRVLDVGSEWHGCKCV